MHPDFKDDEGFLYLYPGEFEIYYYIGDQENPFVHNHTSAVLKEVNVRVKIVKYHGHKLKQVQR